MKICIYDNDANAEVSVKLRKFAVAAKENGHDVVWRNPNAYAASMLEKDVDLVVLNSKGSRQDAAKADYDEHKIKAVYFDSKEFVDAVENIGDIRNHSPELADALTENEVLNAELEVVKSEKEKLQSDLETASKDKESLREELADVKKELADLKNAGSAKADSAKAKTGRK